MPWALVYCFDIRDGYSGVRKKLFQILIKAINSLDDGWVMEL
jgi:hypothetical protein